jgi:phosphate transport system substrate-binding protein
MQENIFMNVKKSPTILRCILATVTIALGASHGFAQDKIVIRGSNTLGEELVPRLVVEYKKDHKDAAFDLEFKGSGYGVGALMGSYCDIAASSKPLSKEQLEVAPLRGVKFKESVIGSYAVSILVNAENPVSNLTSNQVQSLFTGKITNWKEVGGPDAPVHLYVRDPVSGTYLGFKELAMNNQDYSSHEKFFTNYLAIADGVAKDPGGIGYTGLDLAQHPGTKAVTIDGIAPSAANVNAGKYPYARTLRFYTNDEKETVKTKDFISFVLAADGQKVLTQMGYAPKP